MNEQDKLEKLFGQYRDTITEETSSDLWNRLDKRLDERESRKKLSLSRTRYLAVASVAASVMLGIFFILKFNKSPQIENHGVIAELNNQVVQDANKEFEKEKTENPNTAGTTPELNKTINNSNVPAPLSDKPTVQNLPPTTEGAKEMTAEKDNVTMSAPVAESPTAIYADDAYSWADEAVKDMVVKKPETQPIAQADLYKKNEDLKEERESLSEERIADAATEKQAVTVAPASLESKKERGKKKDVRESSKAAPTATKPSTSAQSAALAQFNWLVGTWENKHLEGNSSETWKVSGDGSLEGVGSMTLDGDVLFNERMSIQQDGEFVYFVLGLDNVNRRVRYKLDYVNGSRYTFKLDAEGFPPILILEKKGKNQFDIELSYQGARSFTQDQTAYLNNRNLISSQKSKRSMRKK